MSYVIVYNKKKSMWAVKRTGSLRVFRYTKTQRGAEKIATRILLKNGGGMIRIFRPTGVIHAYVYPFI